MYVSRTNKYFHSKFIEFSGSWLETLRVRFLNEDGGGGEGIDTALCLVSVQGASVQTRFRPGH